MIDKYGIEYEGKFWCNNCSKEIGDSDFETLGHFTKNGRAR